MRLRQQPQLSANALADLLVHGLSRFDTIVHDAKYMQSYVVSRYADAEKEICDYLARLDRTSRHLQPAFRRLTAKVAEATTDAQRDRARDNVAVFEKFAEMEANLGFSGLAFHHPPKTAPLSIEGVLVTVDPNLLIHPLDISGETRVGGIILRLSKGVDPDAAKRKATKDERADRIREMARYTACLLAMQLETSFSHLGSVSPEHCIAVNARLKEVETLGSDRRSRFAEIRKTCRHVARNWNLIEPRPGIRLSA